MWRWKSIHLRVEEASRRLNNADGLVVGGNSVDGVLAVRKNSHKLKAHVLGVHLLAEGVRHGLLFAGGDLERIFLRGQVAQDASLCTGVIKDGAANKRHADRLGFLVVDG